jgi:hypothetical protein
MLANAVRPRRGGLIDMDACCGLPRTRAADVGRAFDASADGMIEDEDAIRLQCRPDERFRRRVVDAPHLFIVIEILDRGRVTNQRKAFAVQRNIFGDQTRIEMGTWCGSGRAVLFGSPGGGSKA